MINVTYDLLLFFPPIFSSYQQDVSHTNLAVVHTSPLHTLGFGGQGWSRHRSLLHHAVWCRLSTCETVSLTTTVLKLCTVHSLQSKPMVLRALQHGGLLV
jgi:hypothetical protein